MKNRLMIGLLFCLASIQIITPLSMITKRENILKYGKQFKFKTAPVDPYDAFRGRYVALRLEEDKIPLPAGLTLGHGQDIYLPISLDAGGFAKFATVATTRPQGAAYIQAKVRYISGGNVHLDLPIDRYYMEEKAAPLAERIYREHIQQEKRDAYVLVRVKDGFTVIEALYVGGKRIEEVVKDRK